MKKSELRSLIREELDKKSLDALDVWARGVRKSIVNFTKSFESEYKLVANNGKTNVGFTKINFDKLTKAFQQYKNNIKYLEEID